MTPCSMMVRIMLSVLNTVQVIHNSALLLMERSLNVVSMVMFQASRMRASCQVSPLVLMKNLFLLSHLSLKVKFGTLDSLLTILSSKKK